jgi:CheY-like chemotaxis protein
MYCGLIITVGLQILASGYNYSHIEGYPDLILLDLNMPMMDGFEALSIIKSNSNLQHIPVYILTTSKAEKDKANALKLGASGFYSKGASLKDIQRIAKVVCLACFN